MHGEKGYVWCVAISRYHDSQRLSQRVHGICEFATARLFCWTSSTTTTMTTATGSHREASAESETVRKNKWCSYVCCASRRNAREEKQSERRSLTNRYRERDNPVTAHCACRVRSIIYINLLGVFSRLFKMRCNFHREKSARITGLMIDCTRELRLRRSDREVWRFRVRSSGVLFATGKMNQT